LGSNQVADQQQGDGYHGFHCVFFVEVAIQPPEQQKKADETKVGNNDLLKLPDRKTPDEPDYHQNRMDALPREPVYRHGQRDVVSGDAVIPS
jgi:hypothetical protein